MNDEWLSVKSNLIDEEEISELDAYDGKYNVEEKYFLDNTFTSDGVLYLVATPIGNLGDISERALEVLAAADVIAAEDTRTTLNLLNRLDEAGKFDMESFATPIISYHEHNKAKRRELLLEYLSDGKRVALVTDAGTPGISDPGEDIVCKAVEKGFKVMSIPGAVAFVNGLIISGLSTRRFVFEGFLPNDKKEHREVLESLRYESRTMVLYEAPHRLARTLFELKEYLGESRKLVLARELTKKYEEVLSKSLGEWPQYFKNGQPRGEYVLVIEGLKNGRKLKAEETSFWNSMSVEEHFEHYLQEGMERKNAVKAVANDRSVSKREIYDLVMK